MTVDTLTIRAARIIIVLAIGAAAFGIAATVVDSCRTNIILDRAGMACQTFGRVDPYWSH